MFKKTFYTSAFNGSTLLKLLDLKAGYCCGKNYKRKSALNLSDINDQVK